MADEKSLTKITNKYLCMVSGEKLMNPCSDCTNTKGCLSRGMQYKENDDLMDQKGLLKISADGGLISCAKGLSADQCGYKVGADVCGACGATPTVGKGGDKMPMDGMPEDEEEYTMPTKQRKARMGAMAAPDMEEDEEEEEEEMPLTPAARQKPQMSEDEEDMEEEEEEDEEDDFMAQRMRMRNRRMATMGLKSADFDDNAFVCAFERKVYPGSSGVCENCPGGCAPEGNLPGLLEIEGIAEDMFSGKVLDSGYSDRADMFVVDVERKDGKIVEVFFEGSTAECQGWNLLKNDMIEQKSLQDSAGSIIDFSEAAQIAVKTIEGEVVGVDPDIFEGYDSYAVEIDGADGKSYDVYVSLDGEVLGYDEYSAEEADEIEAEAAEIALKRAYSEESRQAMARSGHALPDGSYPIKDEADLRNAIQAFGRAKDKEAAKRHIVKRARALGKEDLIPENWMASKADDPELYSDDEAEQAELELKRMYSDDDRDKMAKSGMALPDGSFPIKDEADLRNAIQAYGRAKDKTAAKAHIIKRALSMGKQDLIPMNWVPKKIQEEYAGGKKDAGDEFLVGLLEFELISAEEEAKDVLGGS